MNLDINYLKENKLKLAQAITNKNINLNLEDFFSVAEDLKILKSSLQKLNARKNELNVEIKNAANSNIDKEELIKEGSELKIQIKDLEHKLVICEEKYILLGVKIPTIPSSDTPVGKSADDNVEIAKSGVLPQFDYKIRDHIDLGVSLDILDLEKGVDVSGFRGYYVKNQGALLMLAYLFYALNKLSTKGYTPMITPTIVKEFTMFGSGYFKGKNYDETIDEIYQLSSKPGTGNTEKKFLTGTAEVPLLGYHANETLDLSKLPVKLAGYSACYRSEIGSYSKDVKGIYRVHEFMKVEQVVFCEADDVKADKLLTEMLDISKELHSDLGLPYRILQICTGDMHIGKYKAYDIEVWMPGRNAYGETGSASNFADWQSRRLNIKYKDSEGNKKYVYTLNSTALPSPRIFIAILENHQNKDGSINIPKVLQPYMMGLTKISNI